MGLVDSPEPDPRKPQSIKRLSGGWARIIIRAQREWSKLKYNLGETLILFFQIAKTLHQCIVEARGL